jgi:MraZ protein
LDNQGRILIPPILRQRAGIKEKVLMLGCLNKIEIWDHEVSRTEVEDKIKEVSTLSQILSEQFKF